ncbi:MAG: M48 family metallopeptidase [Candidatus Obscuribacterales bacterium]|nr:M48 family metallopeptidase [Candidatus Obscuribacterales bacterium]
MPKRSDIRKNGTDGGGGQESYTPNEVYQAFMAGYVRRINDATLRVPIAGVRIGSAKYSRLAQINLQTRIITFSRYAIENVPERGRRYLVIHELSHVKEASHNKRFWQFVGEHEPDYKQIGRELEIAFQENVRAELLRQTKKRTPSKSPTQLIFTAPGLLSAQAMEFGKTFEAGGEDYEDFFLEDGEEASTTPADPGLVYPHDAGIIEEPQHLFDCNDDDFGSWYESESGIIHGGY